MDRDTRKEAKTEGKGTQQPLRGTKKFVFWVVLIIPALGLAELVAYIGISNLVPKRISQRVGLDLANSQRAQVFSPVDHAPRLRVSLGSSALPPTPTQGAPLMFHPSLGWDYPPYSKYRDSDGTPYSHDASGERRRCTSFKTTLIAVYGDSFAYCSQVKDHETWETLLARKLRTNVVNFGVGGYGTDQAFLKYEGHRDSAERVAMLCIFPENINRVVNIYRPFYTLNTVVPLTKPRFMIRNGKMEFVPNPTADADSLVELKDADYLRKLGEMDYWYMLSRNHPSLGFPHLWSFFRLRAPILDQMILSASRMATLVKAQSYPWNLFEESEPFSIMCHVVNRFVRTAEKRSAMPVIVFLPHIDYVREIQDYGLSRIARLKKYLQDRKYRYIDAIQAMADLNPTKAELESWYSGHATAGGNKVVAAIIFEHLQRMGLPQSTVDESQEMGVQAMGEAARRSEE